MSIRFQSCAACAKYLIFPIMFFLLLAVNSVYAGDKEEKALFEGLTAYKHKEYKKAWQLLRPMAENGNAVAQHKIGVMYRHGLGVQKSDGDAIHWYRKAAAQGHIRAQNSLGIILRFGLGVEKDPVEAEKWLSAAAEQGDGKGQENLGILYMEGDGVPRDDTKAVYWLRKAAEKGHVRAQFSLGLLTLAGRGVSQDEKTGMAWVRRAAEMGHPQAAGALAKAYAEGLYGLKQDIGQARFWYQRAGKRFQ